MTVNWNMKEEDQEKKNIQPPLQFLVPVRALTLLTLHTRVLQGNLLEMVFHIRDQDREVLVTLAEVTPDQEAEILLAPLKEVIVDHQIVERLSLRLFLKEFQDKLPQVEEIVFPDRHHHNKITELKEEEKEAGQQLRPTQTDTLKEMLREADMILQMMCIDQIRTIVQGIMVMEMTEMIILLGILQAHIAGEMNLAGVQRVGGEEM